MVKAEHATTMASMATKARTVEPQEGIAEPKQYALIVARKATYARTVTHQEADTIDLLPKDNHNMPKLTLSYPRELDSMLKNNGTWEVH